MTGLAAFLALVYVPPGAGTALAQGSHLVEYLGPAWSVVEVNDNGVAIGTQLDGGTGFAGWVWSPEQGRRALPMPAGMVSTTLHDINELAVIVGALVTSLGESKAAAWYPDGDGWNVVLLGALPGHTRSAATAINDGGDIVGVSIGGGFEGALPVWFNGPGGVTDLSPSGFLARPVGINESRRVAGGQHRLDLDTMVLEDLGVPTPPGTGYRWVEAGAINEQGSITGSGVLATSLPDNRHVVRYTDTAGWEVLDLLPNAASGGLDIDDDNEVVSQTPAASTLGGSLLPIEGLIRPEDQAWSINDGYYPLAMNNRGQILAIGSNFTTAEYGAVLLSPVTLTAADAPGQTSPRTHIRGVAPNPMRGVTHVTVFLQDPADGVIAVYDALGRHVRTLREGVLPAGSWTLDWDGRDDSGRQVSAGRYFLRFAAAGVVEHAPLMVLR